MESGVEGAGYRRQGLECRVEGVGLRVKGLGSGVHRRSVRHQQLWQRLRAPPWHSPFGLMIGGLRFRV